MDAGLAKIRHERSVKDFPHLTLEQDEYVEYAFSRARVCLYGIFGGAAAALIVILIGFLLVLLEQEVIDEMGQKFLFIILWSLIAATVIVCLFATMIYRGNKLFVTNKHVIQFIKNSPSSESVNVIDLQSIEDVSYHQDGVLATMFQYGTLRLSTVGDETTYTFKYADVTAEEIKGISKLVTDAKKRGKRRAAVVESDESEEEDKKKTRVSEEKEGGADDKKDSEVAKK